MDRILFINLLTLIAIILEVFWSVTDPRPREERVKSYLRPKLILIAIFSAFYFVLNYFSGMYFPLPDSGFDGTLSIAGVLIFAGGVIISVWAKMVMGKVWGIPAEHEKKRQSKLIKSGPFQFTRNPIYVGLIMVMIGYGLALQSYFTFLALIPLYYFWQSAIKEEKLLEEIFKEEYKKYKKEVPRFF